MGKQNPWLVENIEAFNFYCCPECDFQSKDRDYFKRHAVESHKKSKVFFLRSKSEDNTNHDSMEVENMIFEEGIKDFEKGETSVKEESISEFEGEKTVISSEKKKKKNINRADNIKQEDLETFTESSDIVEDNLKTLDDQELEDNLKEIYENITDAEISDGDTSDGIGDELETLDESNVEISDIFNIDNFDHIREVEISDRELEQDLNMESEANIVKAKSFDEDEYSTITKEENSIIGGKKKKIG